jgi:hypothetical protein
MTALNRRLSFSRAARQRGAATLAATLLLLLLGTLAVLASSRGVLLNQKTATSTYHYEQARMAAQAGVERAIAYLSRTGAEAPNRASFLDAATLRVRTETGEREERLEASRGGYRIAFAQPDAADPTLVRIVSTGCADDCAASGAPSVRVTQLVKFRKLVPAPPVDALIARGPVGKVNGNFSVAARAPGAPIRSGQAIAALQGSADTGGRAVVANDPVLQATSAEAYFRYFFGDTPAALRGQLPTLPEDAGLVQGGAYWLGDGADTVTLHGDFGTAERPVVLIVDGDLRINATATVRGAIAVQGQVDKLNGNMDLVHDADVLANLSAWAAPAKVPGSWKDF